MATAHTKPVEPTVEVLDHPEETEALVVQHAAVPTPMPVFAAQDMIQAFDAYQDLQKQLDQRMPEAIISVRGNKFRKKVYWRTIAAAFNLSVGEVKGSGQRVVITDDAGKTTDWGYTCTYRASSPGGRFADGDGTCMSSEKTGKSGEIFATEHNVKSHAQTRGFNRAVSNLVGFGEVSADELNLTEHRPPTQTESDLSTTGLAGGQHRIAEVLAGKSGTVSKGKRKGQPWQVFKIKLEDGTVLSTFDAANADLAEEAIKRDVPAMIEMEKRDKYMNLVSIALPDEEGDEEGERGESVSDATLAEELTVDDIPF